MKTFTVTILIVCALYIFNIQAQTIIVSSGKLDHIQEFKSEYVAPRPIDVWLPDGYSPRKKYAVLYMHDGQMLFDSTASWNKQEWMVDETVSALLAKKEIRDCIVVGIWNTEFRHSEYFPQKPLKVLPSAFHDSLINNASRNSQASLFKTAVQSDNYLKFIVEELKPYIDKNYATLTDSKSTFIAGSSMGGLISMYALCEYPQIFGGAACLSTHWPGVFHTKNNPLPNAFLNYMREHLPDPKNHKIYFDFGTATLDELYEPFQQQADEILKEKGYTVKNWLTLKFDGENHSEKAWASRLKIPLIFLLKR